MGECEDCRRAVVLSWGRCTPRVEKKCLVVISTIPTSPLQTQAAEEGAAPPAETEGCIM